MINTGTLVGAPIRPNDSEDQYPSALQEEIKGGAHTRSTITEMNAIGSWLREAGMTCFVIADGNTYQLQIDLVTWSLLTSSGGGTTNPGSGGDSDGISLISGNFGKWTALDSPSGETVDQIELKYKTDLPAFTGRQITYLQGQFSLNADFTGKTITLGNLPLNNRPSANIIKYFIVENIEMYLLINTDGDVILSAKDEFNLPTGNVDAPYYIDTFFQPVITPTEPTTYTSTRTEDFVKNNCGSGYDGSTVSFSKSYTSTVSQDIADALASADTGYTAEGQAYANDPSNGGICTLDPDTPTKNLVIKNTTNFDDFVRVIEYVELTGGEVYTYTGIAPLAEVDANIGAYVYNIDVKILDSSGSNTVTVNGVSQTLTTTNPLFHFLNINTPINIQLS